MDMKIDGKSASEYYGLNLQSWAITTPVRKRYTVDIPCADGNVDLMEGLSAPRYEMRTLTATFRARSTEIWGISDMLMRELEGRTVNIVLPDDSDHYMIGRMHISSVGGKPITEVSIYAECYPWRYAAQVTVVTCAASESEVEYTLSNSGTRDAVPDVIVSDQVVIAYGSNSMALGKGTYQLVALTIPGNGQITIKVSGGGSVEIRYQEAIL